MKDLIEFLITQMKRDKGCVIPLVLSSNMLQMNGAFYIFTHSWRYHQNQNGTQVVSAVTEQSSKASKGFHRNQLRRGGRQQKLIRLCLNYFFKFVVVNNN